MLIVVVAAIGVEMTQAVAARLKFTNDPPLLALPRLIARNPRRYGGYIVHIGIVIIAVGIAAYSHYNQEALRGLQVGESAVIGPYTIVFEGLQEGEERGVPHTAAQVLVTARRPRHWLLDAEAVVLSGLGRHDGAQHRGGHLLDDGG